ncbi:WD repeat-containing protein 44-like isoform X2 [Ciona intestinalis]
MSHCSNSDSDDFFDARPDFGSPKCPSSPSLVVDDGTNGTTKHKNPNSPCHLGGDLSLDNLLKSATSSTSVVSEDEGSYILNNSSSNNTDPISHDDSVFLDKHEKFGADNAKLCHHNDSSTINQSEASTNANQSESNQPLAVSHEGNHPCTSNDTSLGKRNSSISSSKPDLVASISERPTNLPGVKPALLFTQENEAPESKLERRTLSKESLSRPKRPPPPRPKAPPKRPPPPKPMVHKNLTSSIDDPLLTPNTTVDNITREFAAALSKVTATNNIDDQPCTHDKEENTNVDKPDNINPTLPTTDERKESTTSNKSHRPSIDEEILSTVIVRNLDTGQTMPLSVAAEQVSQCLNPLALQIMSRTKEFACAGSDDPQPTAPPSSRGIPTPTPADITPINLSEDDNTSIASDDITIGAEASSKKGYNDSGRKIRTKSKRFKRMLGKSARRVKEVAETQVERAVHKVKHGKHEATNSESLNVSSDEEVSDSLANSTVKIKASSTNKGPFQFHGLKQVQDIAVHVGAVWSMKFSHCGRLLATAGQNNVIWVWVLKDYYAYFNEMRSKYVSKERGAVFATPPRNTMEPPTQDPPNIPSEDRSSRYESSDQLDEEEEAPFRSLPFSSYVGHSADVLDLAWSKNYFTLSSSMDKTVRLWHVSQKECLCCFQHIDFVTAISFHPRDDRYFLSGSLDSKLRLWNIPEKKVALWNEVTPDSSSNSSGGALITTVNFCENGKFAVCGTYDGRCLFYDTEHLKYHTQIHVRSSRGRNTKGHKITGIEPLPAEHKILVTSNDSRVRLYDLRDLSLTCKYKGLTNMSSQIKASFSHDCKYIVCGSEDKSVYIWKTNVPQDVTKFRRDRNDCWESIRAHDAVVTCAIFAPYPHLMARSDDRTEGSRLSFSSKSRASPNTDSCCIISADFKGVIKIFMNS